MGRNSVMYLEDRDDLVWDERDLRVCGDWRVALGLEDQPDKWWWEGVPVNGAKDRIAKLRREPWVREIVGQMEEILKRCGCADHVAYHYLNGYLPRSHHRRYRDSLEVRMKRALKVCEREGVPWKTGVGRISSVANASELRSLIFDSKHGINGIPDTYYREVATVTGCRCELCLDPILPDDGVRLALGTYMGMTGAKKDWLTFCSFECARQFQIQDTKSKDSFLSAREEGGRVVYGEVGRFEGEWRICRYVFEAVSMGEWVNAKTLWTRTRALGWRSGDMGTFVNYLNMYVVMGVMERRKDESLWTSGFAYRRIREEYIPLDMRIRLPAEMKRETKTAVLDEF